MSELVSKRGNSFVKSHELRLDQLRRLWTTKARKSRLVGAASLSAKSLGRLREGAVYSPAKLNVKI